MFLLIVGAALAFNPDGMTDAEVEQVFEARRALKPSVWKPSDVAPPSDFEEMRTVAAGAPVIVVGTLVSVEHERLEELDVAVRIYEVAVDEVLSSPPATLGTIRVVARGGATLSDTIGAYAAPRLPAGDKVIMALSPIDATLPGVPSPAFRFHQTRYSVWHRRELDDGRTAASVDGIPAMVLCGSLERGALSTAQFIPDPTNAALITLPDQVIDAGLTLRRLEQVGVDDSLSSEARQAELARRAEQEQAARLVLESWQPSGEAIIPDEMVSWDALVGYFREAAVATDGETGGER